MATVYLLDTEVYTHKQSLLPPFFFQWVSVNSEGPLTKFLRINNGWMLSPKQEIYDIHYKTQETLWKKECNKFKSKKTWM